MATEIERRWKYIARMQEKRRDDSDSGSEDMGAGKGDTSRGRGISARSIPA